MRSAAVCAVILFLTCACARIDKVGKAPEFSPSRESDEYFAMAAPPFPVTLAQLPPSGQASLWNSGRASLLGDRRAMAQGDILTVVIEINDSAEISNSSQRTRSGSESFGLPELFGIPQRIDEEILGGNASLSNAVDANSSSSSSGDGSVKRNEKLTLRIAATVTGVLPNGILQVVGRQEVRVNFELRELLVTGYVRPQDVSRQNEITYDKIASARISYGGRGRITEVQQPRWGQQVTEFILPF